MVPPAARAVSHSPQPREVHTPHVPRTNKVLIRPSELCDSSTTVVGSLGVSFFVSLCTAGGPTPNQALINTGGIANGACPVTEWLLNFT